MKLGAIYTYVVVILLAGDFCRADEYAINEQFDNLDAWISITFPKIEKQTEYDILKAEKGSVLVARSNGSASGIRCTKEFNVYDFPVVRWRWRVENVYTKGNVLEKSGDDYPLRVYIMFKYDPDKASFGDKVKYGLAKMVYGEYPPLNSLNYIWANKPQEKRIYPSTYTDKAQLVILRAGQIETGKWVEEQVNIIEDYQLAFEMMPPEIASIAIMSDSDNTGEQAVSYMDYIQVMQSE